MSELHPSDKEERQPTPRTDELRRSSNTMDFDENGDVVLVEDVRQLEGQLARTERDLEVSRGLENMAYDQRDKAWEDLKAARSSTREKLAVSLKAATAHVDLTPEEIEFLLTHRPEDWPIGSDVALVRMAQRALSLPSARNALNKETVDRAADTLRAQAEEFSVSPIKFLTIDFWRARAVYLAEQIIRSDGTNANG